MMKAASDMAQFLLSIIIHTIILQWVFYFLHGYGLNFQFLWLNMCVQGGMKKSGGDVFFTTNGLKKKMHKELIKYGNIFHVEKKNRLGLSWAKLS